MACESNARTRGAEEGEESILKGRAPILPTISTGGALDLDGISEIDPARTPTSELSSLPSSIHTPAASWTSEDPSLLPHGVSFQDSRHGDLLIQPSGDHFPPALQDRNVAQLSRATSTSSLSSVSDERLVHRRSDSTSARQSPNRHPSVSRDLSNQTVIGITSNAQLPAVPKQQTPLRRRLDRPDYPVYPDQSFAALQSQHYPPPYQPHPLRTRSSHPSQSSSYPASTPRSRAYSAIPSGAKTVGNTPVQSPGLFTPTTAKNKARCQDCEENPYSTPKLHPTHLQTPKETHKLVKDHDPISGRKVVNNYEFLEKLGSGQHGTVKLGRETNGQNLVAIKIVRRFSKKLRLGKLGDPNDMIKKEVAILKKARHAHVVSLLEVIDDDEFGKVYLVLEFVERGEIVWRKKTDKDIAVFEMNRIKREKSQQADEQYEEEARQKFNAGADSRRKEKARILDEQKRQAQSILKARAEQKRRDHLIDSPFWSLEYATELEEEQVSEASEEITTPPPEISSPPDFDTPRPLSSARSRSGRSSDKRSHEIAFQSTLDQIIAAQTHWTAEEEEFMQVPCLTISQASEAFRDTVLGLEYLHYQGIIHRDIKPANLLWTSDRRVKISDFGVSYLGKPIREDDNREEIAEADADDLDEAIELAKTVGTPAFYAPELCDPELFDFSKNPDRPLITGQIDVWALGVTLYAMIFGRLPFFDVNEFAMYEKIARQEVFIPRLRLKGVENREADSAMKWRTQIILEGVEEKGNPRLHETQEEDITLDESRDPNKRPDDILEYEEVDDELRDLLRRLLDKQPLKRIGLKDVKRHPWVIRGVSDLSAWLDETDPSVQSQGRKIEVSREEVQEAVVQAVEVGRLVDRAIEKFNNTIRRIGSVVRGRADGRKRRHSNSNATEKTAFTATSKGSVSSQDGRRSSLRGDERYSAPRALREGSEHPLSQSVAASPEMKPGQAFFDDNSGPISSKIYESTDRPTLLERTLSNAESTRTIRPAVSTLIQGITPSSAEFSPMTPVPDSNSSTSSLSIFFVSVRGFMGASRRDRGRGGESASQSSRTSSLDNHSQRNEDFHASASLATSSAMAAGHVDQPFAHHNFEMHKLSTIGISQTSQSQLPNSSSVESLQDYGWESDRRHSRHFPRATSAADLGSPSPDDESDFRENRSSFSHSDGAHPFAISSSSDQIASGISESTSHPSIPSVISGASSLSANTGDSSSLLKDIAHTSTLTSRSPRSVLVSDKIPDRSSPGDETQTVDDDEAGYNGEGEFDSDSDDGIEMGLRRLK